MIVPCSVIWSVRAFIVDDVKSVVSGDTVCWNYVFFFFFFFLCFFGLICSWMTGFYFILFFNISNDFTINNRELTLGLL